MRIQSMDTSAIENSAIALFYEKGYDNCSIREIAAKANCSHSTLIRYYQSKSSLGFLFLERYINELVNATFDLGETHAPYFNKDQDLLFFYWCLHHYYLYHDTKLRKFYLEFYHANFEKFNEFHYFLSKRVFPSVFNLSFDSNDIGLQARSSALCAIEGTLLSETDFKTADCEELINTFLSLFLKLFQLEPKPSDEELHIFIQRFFNDDTYITQHIKEGLS